MESETAAMEFDDRNVIDDLANKMIVSSWMFYFLAAERAVSAVAPLFRSGQGNWGAIVQAVLFFVFGLFNSQAAWAFKIVVNSSANQFPLLVDALRKLRRQYTLIYWFVLIAVVLNVFLFFV